MDLAQQKNFPITLRSTYTSHPSFLLGGLPFPEPTVQNGPQF